MLQNSFVSTFIGGDTAMNNDEYSEFSAFLLTACGIVLGDNKQYLVSTRIRRILIDHRLENLRDLTRRITQAGDRVLRQKVIDAMTTNETFWFRDTYPFDYLERVLIPSFITTGEEKLRVWSAACSSGQEPYSISMLFEEYAQRNQASRRLNTEVVATDLSSQILEKARIGHYDKLAIIRGLSNLRAKQHFSQIDDETWKVNKSIKSRVSFKALNLQESFYMMGPFDVVFCRNVLIYFSTDLKQNILKKIHSTLAPGGILFLGSSETVNGLSDYYDVVHCDPGVAYRAKPYQP